MRTVPTIFPRSGMMLKALEEVSRQPTLSTAVSLGDTSREMTVWNALPIWNAAGVGSTASSGAEPWPPAPSMVRFQPSQAA